MIAVVGLLILGFVAIGVFNWGKTGDNDADQPGWMYQEGSEENPQYGLALRTDEGFERGPRFADGWVQSWELMGEKGPVENRTVTLPKFGSGYVAMVWKTDSDPIEETSALQLADSKTVIDLDVQSGSVDGQKRYVDRRRGALYYSLNVGDRQSCRVVYAKDSKPFEAATGRDCRWAPDGRAVATDWSRTSASYRMYDAKGKELATGEFPAGNYEEFGAPGWQPSGGWIWAIGTDEPAELPDDGAYQHYNESLWVLDLDTGRQVTSLAAADISAMALAEQGRGLVVAVDDHKGSLDAVYLDPDGKEAARIRGLAAAQAVISQDGRQAWVAGDNGQTVNVSYVAPGAQPRDVLQPAPRAVSLLRARDGQLLMAAQGDTPDAYRVLRVTPSGEVQTILEGKATGLEDRSSEVRTGAESAVGVASVGGLDLLSAPATSGAWTSVWQLLPDEARILIPVVDYGEGDNAQAKVLSGAENETVVLYSGGGQEKLVAVRDGAAVPLGESTYLIDLGFAEGKFWFNVKGSESDQWQTKKVAVDGKGAAEDVNLTLGAVAGTAESSYFSRDGFVTTAWTDPLRAD